MSEELNFTEAQNRYSTGKGFLETTKVVYLSPHKAQLGTSYILPTHLLIGFAIELYLKAWLLESGKSSKDVRKYGHNIELLFSDAMSLGLQSDASLDMLISVFKGPHADYTFRYIEDGDVITTINWPLAYEALDRLDEAVDTKVGASKLMGLEPGH